MTNPSQNQGAGNTPDINTDVAPTLNVSVTVSTASALITHPDNRYLILVGDSEKHEKPVIIGGKVELQGFPELDNILAKTVTAEDLPAVSCVYRESWEEVVDDSLARSRNQSDSDVAPEKTDSEKAREMLDMWLSPPVLIGKATDPERDVRTVPISKVAAALIDPPLDSFIEQAKGNMDAKIQASYGTPDYIFVGTLKPELVRPTEELSNPRYVDVRDLSLGDLSAGHDVVALQYREMLDSNATSLPDDALANFQKVREDLAN